MINLFDLYRSLTANVNPSQGGHIRPQENFMRWCNEIQQEIFEELARKWETNQTISDKLTPFLRSVNVSLTPNPGKPYDTFVPPADYRYFATARVLLTSEDAKVGTASGNCPTIDGNTGAQQRYEDPDDVKLAEAAVGSGYVEVPVRKVDNMRWGSAMAHITKRPTIRKPLITAYDGGFKMAPAGMGVIVLDYFRMPKDCLFAYTMTADGQIIFDPVNSVNLEWNANVIPDFLARLETRYGIYVRDDMTFQSGQLKRTQVKS